MNEADRKCFGRVEQAVRLSRYGGDCYAYCVLAAGHADLIIETELKPHDVLALIPIIEGAGGIVSTWENGSPYKGGRIVAAGDRRVHEQAMKYVANALGALVHRINMSSARRNFLLRDYGFRARAFRRARNDDLIRRRSGHEGIERRPELRAEAVLLHQQLMLGADHDELRAGAQLAREVLDRRV